MATRKILYLCVLLSTLYLPTAAQPTRDDIIRAQHTVLDRLADFAFVRQTTVESYDKNGQLKVSAAYVHRCISLDDGNLHCGTVMPTLGLYGLTLSRLDEDAGFLPIFVTTASLLTYEGMDGALYRVRVERLNGIPGFEGRLWVTHNGFVAQAAGRIVAKGRKPNEAPLRFTYRAKAGLYVPAELVEDDVVGGRRVRVTSRYVGYMKHVTSSREVEDEP